MNLEDESASSPNEKRSRKQGETTQRGWDGNRGEKGVGEKRRNQGNRGKRSNSSQRYRMKGLNKRNPCFRSVSENPATVASSFTRSTRTFSSTKKVSTIPKEHCKMPFPFLPLSLSLSLSLSVQWGGGSLLVSVYTRPLARLLHPGRRRCPRSPERPPNSRCFARSITISRWPGEIHSLIRMPIGN